MNRATHPACNRIAVVFDFDETLIPDDSFKVLLSRFGFDPDTFKKERIQPLRGDNWDKYLARAYCLVQASKQLEKAEKITKEKLANLGKELRLIEGVPEMFDQLRDCAAQVNSDVELEFYLLTGGFAEIARNTSIAKHFRGIWGCEFSFDAEGEIEFIKSQMTHTEKTRYLFYISKGIDSENEKDLIYNYRDLPIEELHIPLNQMIYVGDGTSDIPCFTVVNEYHGIGIGIHKEDNHPTEWEARAEIAASQRVANIAPANYSENSELTRSLLLSVESICKQISLRQLSAGE
ncbi:haloacid dehalogenase-like hydrolase [Lusitaniella coriacea LEGE 07157]|uniref:Haloacid dehalogenase-like hydrolase n=1 Tax=Lusitaniella coriacea LEGE 07157 TaxID=945747 RepID=A0A8J7B8K7_9CYAN|nr:haloacid dehalogenase-like hydrolase [Lusitaniella coriacea]MBE9114658.1 haloacid dehalogenase-like hydrolase [Lusitaniella coriacea LEGE 07157]